MIQYTHWISRPRAPMSTVVNYLLSLDTGEYGDSDIRYIVQQYWVAGELASVDPVLASAQMILETAHLSSWWSQRPRRNPAGIGVTGEPGAGLSFPSWEQSARAHIGRILAYALPVGAGNADQKALITEALAYRGLPDARRGQGADIDTLSRCWAADPDYATKLASLGTRLAG